MFNSAFYLALYSPVEIFTALYKIHDSALYYNTVIYLYWFAVIVHLTEWKQTNLTLDK